MYRMPIQPFNVPPLNVPLLLAIFNCCCSRAICLSSVLSLSFVVIYTCVWISTSRPRRDSLGVSYWMCTLLNGVCVYTCGPMPCVRVHVRVYTCRVSGLRTTPGSAGLITFYGNRIACAIRPPFLVLVEEAWVGKLVGGGAGGGGSGLHRPAARSPG